MDLTLPPIRGRAEQFHRAVDAAPATPAQATGLGREVALAGRLREVGGALAPAPSAEFRAALRTRLLAVAAVQDVGATSAAPTPAAVSWRQRAGAVAVGVLATVVAVSGVAVAGSRSLPGDPFYGLKRTTEAVQLRLADGAESEGERHLQFAGTRLREVRALVLGRDGAGRDGALGADDDRRVREVLEDMDDETRAGLRLLTDAFRETEEPEPLRKLTDFADEQRAGLADVLPALPGPSRARAEQSLALVADVRAQADELLLLVDCTVACDPSATAPVLPPAQTPEGTAVTPPPCACPTPVPAPSLAPAPGPEPSTASPAPAPTPSPSSTPAPSEPASPSPTPTPSPSSSPPLPLPLPTLPTLPPLEPLEPLGPVQIPPLTGDDGVLSGLLGVAPLLLVGPGAASVTRRVLHWWRRHP